MPLDDQGATYGRVERVAEQVRRELGDILIRKTKDPRLHACVVSRVRMSKDLRVAWVSLSVFPEERRQDAEKALEAATGYLRRELSARVDLRRSPELRFEFDDAARQLIEMDKLTRSLLAAEDEEE